MASVTLATWITLARLLLVAPMLVMAHLAPERWFVPLLVVLWIAMLSDIADGWIARFANQRSALGGFLDPLTDKILIYCLLFTFYGHGVYSVWTVFPMFIRDTLVDGWRSYGASQGRVLASNVWGKLKFSLQFVSLNAAILAMMVPDAWASSVALAANGILLAALVASLPGCVALAKPGRAG